MLSDCQVSFTIRLGSKFVLKSLLNSPSQLTRVAALPCEILLSKKLATAAWNVHCDRQITR